MIGNVSVVFLWMEDTGLFEAVTNFVAAPFPCMQATLSLSV